MGRLGAPTPEDLAPVYLHSIATAVPATRVATREMLAALEGRISSDIRTTLLGLGVETRCTVITNFLSWLAGETTTMERSSSATLLALRAARRCIERSGVKPETVGLLVAVTNTQSRLLPALACEIMAHLAGTLSRRISIVNMQGQGCSALLKAIELSGWFLRVHPEKRVLVVVSEVQTPYMPQLDQGPYAGFGEIKRRDCGREEARTLARRTEEIIQSFLFGDGAVALLFGRAWTNGQLRFGSVRHLTNVEPEDVDLLTMPEGGSESPAIEGRPRYHMHPRVPARGAAYAADVVNALVSTADTVPLEHDHVAYLIHTGSRKIVDAVCERLGVDKDGVAVRPSYDVLRTYGNLSSASLGFMLAENRFTHGHGLAVSFGVGFSASATTFTPMPLPDQARETAPDRATRSCWVPSWTRPVRLL